MHANSILPFLARIDKTTEAPTEKDSSFFVEEAGVEKEFEKPKTWPRSPT